jgi:thymidylate synthase (FAD)
MILDSATVSISDSQNGTLNDIIDIKHPVLSGQGFLRVVDFMGDDSSLVKAARISYGNTTKTPAEDEKLIRFLLKHKHESPVEMVVLKVHIKAPLFVRSQWVRHRMSSFNEYSARYSEMSDEFYCPNYEMFQKQAKKNHQGREGCFTQAEYNELIEKMRESHMHSYQTYQELLSNGVAREIARGVLPTNLMTEFYWQVNGRSLMNFLKLRCDQNGQAEIREYALLLLNIFEKWLPVTARAFKDYIMNSHSYSENEDMLLWDSMDNEELGRNLDLNSILSKREKDNLRLKMR